MQVSVVSPWTISVQVCDAFLHFHLFRPMNTTITRRWAAQQWLNFCQTHSTTRDSSHTTLSMCWPDWTPKVEYDLSTNLHWPFNVIMWSCLLASLLLWQVKDVSLHTMLLGLMRGQVIVLREQVQRWWCLFLTTSWNPLVLSYFQLGWVLALTNFKFKRKGSREFELLTPFIWMFC